MAITCVLVASAAIIPAASDGISVPDPGRQYGPARVMPVQVSGERVVTISDLAGWQITVIAAGAEVHATAAAIRLDRALTGRAGNHPLVLTPGRGRASSRSPPARLAPKIGRAHV